MGCLDDGEQEGAPDGEGGKEAVLEKGTGESESGSRGRGGGEGGEEGKKRVRGKRVRGVGEKMEGGGESALEVGEMKRRGREAGDEGVGEIGRKGRR